MFSLPKHLFLCVILYVLISESCVSETVAPPTLVVYSPGEPEYTDVVVKRAHDNLTLVCELRGDAARRTYVWNYVADNQTFSTGDRPFTIAPMGPAARSTLVRMALRASDSGRYMCSVPPFSVTKYILVQNKGPMQCARGAFWCGARCVLAAYVCDGRRDCLHGEDEHAAMCDHNICARPDKLNCSTGRCISEAACCRGGAPLCQQPACCDEFTRRGDLEGYAELDYPPLFEDRRAPDDYGFIQSTIYTVTACALIFMIAVVLLVSAICKMQMKRAALRGYTHADRATARHYSVQYHQTHRFPPCYEASRLLEQEGRPPSPVRSPSHVPAVPPDLQCGAEQGASPRGLARLSAIFSSRYRQVPTQPADVELTLVPPRVGGAHAPQAVLPPYRSPAGGARCLADTGAALGAQLNYTPELSRRDTLERVMDQLDRQRLTLQLGRFQLQLPRWRGGGGGARPGTPDVAALDLSALDFVRLDATDTYTLNGRTIRLLGADIEDYPAGAAHTPPSYTEAVRYKLYGPPPEYLSRERLNRSSADTVDEDAAANIEMPPCYEELTAANGTSAVANGKNNVITGENDVVNGNDNNVSGASDIVNGNSNFAIGARYDISGNNNNTRGTSDAVTGNNDVISGNNDVGLGNNLAVSASNKIVIGISSVANENSAVAIGKNNVITGANYIVNGNDNNVSGASDVINESSNVASGARDVITVNCNNTSGASSAFTVNNNVTGANDIVKGNNLVDSASNKVVIGNSGVALGNSNAHGNDTKKLDKSCAVILDNGNDNKSVSTAIAGSTPVHNSTQNNERNTRIETLRSIIDNLPAIDCDVNANDSETSVSNDHVIRDNVRPNDNANCVINNVSFS